MERDRTAGHRHGSPQNNMNALAPGRSAMPPGFGLKASGTGPNSLLSASIGRDGENKPEDLMHFGKYLLSIGLPQSAVIDVLNPSSNGALIEKYQRQVLGFKNPDGRIDPGGKTETAIRDQRGRDVVAGWYVKPRPSKSLEGPAESDQRPLGGFSDVELNVKQYWQTQKAGKCNVYAKKVIEGHRKDHPELYEGLGDIGNGLTAKDNSLHLVWEKEWEKAGNRTQGEKGKNEVSTLERDDSEWDMAIRYIQACLRKGVPVMVGLNHTFAYKNAMANTDKTTDHWVAVIGMGSDQSGKYLSYTDPGTTHKSVGTDTTKNRLYQTKDPHIWRDETKYAAADAGKGSYTLVAVSLYDAHRGKKKFSVGGEVFDRK